VPALEMMYQSSFLLSIVVFISLHLLHSLSV
jgi:hypothetical protein